jgi:hypothetical protein
LVELQWRNIAVKSHARWEYTLSGSSGPISCTNHVGTLISNGHSPDVLTSLFLLFQHRLQYLNSKFLFSYLLQAKYHITLWSSILKNYEMIQGAQLSNSFILLMVLNEAKEQLTTILSELISKRTKSEIYKISATLRDSS